MYMYIAFLTVLFKTWISWVGVSSCLLTGVNAPSKNAIFACYPWKLLMMCAILNIIATVWCCLHYFLRMGEDIIKKFTSVSSLTIYISIRTLFSILFDPSSGTEKAVLSISFEVGGYLNKHLLENVCKTISLLSAH